MYSPLPPQENSASYPAGRRPQNTAGSNRRTGSPLEILISAALIVIITSAVFFPILTHEFAGWDDTRFIGAVWKPSWERAKAILLDWELKHGAELYYDPLHFLSLMLDQALTFGADRPQAWIAKFFNLFFHLVSSLLVFKLLLMTGVGRRAALIAALVFAVHPLQVATVAWVSERKNLLACIAYLACVIFFINYLRGRRGRDLAGLVVFFVLGLLSKPSTVTVPVALAIIPLVAPPQGEEPRFPRGAIVTLAALFAASLAWGIFVLSTERTYPWVLPPWPYRPLIAATALWFYLSKLVLPTGLVPVYPKWDVQSAPIPFAALTAAMGVLVGAFALFWKRIDGWIRWGVLLALVNLLPVLGLIPFGYMSHSYVADHFMYVPMIGVAVAIARCVDYALSRIGDERAIGQAVMAALYIWVCVLGVLTVRQTLHWRDPAAMWEATLRVNQTSSAVHNNYALLLMKRGEYDKALHHLQRALEISPKLLSSHNALAQLYLFMGEREKAKEMYRRSIKLTPRQDLAPGMLGKLLREEGKPEESIEFFKDAIRKHPSSAVLRKELALSLYEAGREEAALKALDEAIHVNPFFPRPYLKKSVILLNKGDVDAAIPLLKRTLELTENAEARNALGVAYAQQGRTKAAIKEFLTAFRRNPGLKDVRDNAANALMEAGRFREALEVCARAEKRGFPCSERTLERLRVGKPTE